MTQPLSYEIITPGGYVMDKITHKVRCEQWTAIINECLASGMPKTTWCKANGISDKQQEFYVGIPFGEVSYGLGDHSL